MKDCPLPDCNTCEPEALPLDVVAELERTREEAHAAAWLITSYPDVWYFEEPAALRGVATRLVAVRRQVDAGKVTP